jgi:hypothetical protein
MLSVWNRATGFGLSRSRIAARYVRSVQVVHDQRDSLSSLEIHSFRKDRQSGNFVPVCVTRSETWSLQATLR